MKTKSIVIASLLGAASLAFAGENVDVAQLPAAVRKAVDTSARGETVKKVTLENLNGRNVYRIEFERENAPNPILRVAEDGHIMHSTSALDPTNVSAHPEFGPSGIPLTPAVPSLSLSDVPEPARQTIQRAAAGREIAAIHTDTVEGQKAYAVEFRDRGRNPRLHVADDGKILRPTEKPPALLIGTTFSDTPTTVQEVIRREAPDSEILKIDRERSADESNVYTIELKDARGVYRLRVSESGDILENSRATDRPTNRG